MKKMIQIILMLFVVLLPALGFSESKDFAFKDYDEAKKAESFVRFDMASTKVGLFTTHFSGFVKKFSVTGNLKSNKIHDAVISFDVKEMDTDIDGRNEKMWNQCLDAEKHPTIKIQIKEVLLVDGESKVIPATITVRGESHTIELSAKVSQENENLVFDFKGELSLEDLNIPDPSIAIASVKDKVDIIAHINIK